MPDLKWDPQDLLECLGVIPDVGEYEISYSYKLKKDGLVLALTLWQHEELVHLALSKDNAQVPFLELTFFVLGEIVHVNTPEPSGLKFTRSVVGAPNAWVDLSDESITPLAFDLDLYVYPNLEIKIPRTFN